LKTISGGIAVFMTSFCGSCGLPQLLQQARKKHFEYSTPAAAPAE
jgi:hypothetical protein